MTIYDLKENLKLRYDTLEITGKYMGKKANKKLLIVLGYALEMLNHICEGAYIYGECDIDGHSDAKDITRNVLVNHCRAEQDYKNQLEKLCLEVSYGGNFECYNWDLAERLGLKPERWQYKGVELLKRQAFYIKKAVLLIEKMAGIKRDKNGDIIYECK